jgi:type IV pilus assembly protein PilP
VGVTIVCGSTLLVGGCGGGDYMADLEMRLEEIRRQPPGRIDPPPKFKTYENFIYGATLLRSPFQPPVEEEEVRPTPKGGRNVAPDPYRQKEVLEDYSLEALTMVGTIQRDGDGLYALIKDNKLVVHRVLPGNYIGRNHGKILKITPGKLDVMELVPDGQGGWVERPRTVTLKNE